MVILMLKQTRRHENGIVEPWLDFHIRSCRNAKLAINAKAEKHNVAKLLPHKKRTFAGHISRFGINNREEHLVKHIVCWRNAFWWHFQRKQIAIGEDCFTHPKVGKIARWELQFPRNWITSFSSDAWGP